MYRFNIMKLRVNEIFYSIQGESSLQGRPCIFIRLTGCRLRCSYCDTKYSYHQGDLMEASEILGKISDYPCKLVQLTGGEPLEHPEAPAFMQLLVDQGYVVMLETDGQEDIRAVPKEVKIIFDVKTPGSGMASPVTDEHIQNLRTGDEVKFVICDEADYAFAKAYIERFQLCDRFTVLFSPAMLGKDALADKAWLADNILRDGLNVRLQPQMHKLIWGARRGV